MKVLVGTEVWQRIRELNADRAKSAVVFSAYFGSGGAKLLPLRSGDQLVVAASEANVRAGNVNPNELLKYPAGVLIYSSPALHGKGYFFDSKAVLTSANVSTNSRDRLIEFAVEVGSSQTLVASILDRVPRRLLTLGDLRGLARLYKPPRAGPIVEAPLDEASKKSWTKPNSSSRIWYHGTFGGDWVRGQALSIRLPSLRRVQRGDWYIRVFWKAGERFAAPPRLVSSVTARGDRIKLMFARGEFDDHRAVPATEVESLVVPGAPPIRMRWQQVSDRIPSNRLFALFGRKAAAVKPKLLAAE